MKNGITERQGEIFGDLCIKTCFYCDGVYYAKMEEISLVVSTLNAFNLHTHTPVHFEDDNKVSSFNLKFVLDE